MFTRLIEEHGAALRRLAAVYFDDRSAREDLFQEIAMAVWVGIPGFRGDASERTWLYRIAHNTACSRLVKLRERRDRERQPREADPEPAGVEVVESDFDAADQRNRFFSALRGLPTVEFQIVTMHLDGLSYSEIAEVVGLTQTNVGARLSRIRQALTDRLRSVEAKP